MAKELTAKFKNRADTANNWASANPILDLGEIGLEKDTSKIKFGNGVSTWNNLPYYSDIAKDAAKVTIEDTGSHYTSGNVEGALQEVGEQINDLDAEVVAHKANNAAHNLVWSKVAKVVLSVDSAQVNTNIPDEYEFIKVTSYCRSTNLSTDRELRIRFNDDDSISYGFSLNHIAKGDNIAKANDNAYGSNEMIIRNIEGFKKIFVSTSVQTNGTSVTNSKGEWIKLEKITKINFIASADMFKAGCEFHVWGAK